MRAIQFAAVRSIRMRAAFRSFSSRVKNVVLRVRRSQSSASARKAPTISAGVGFTGHSSLFRRFGSGIGGAVSRSFL